jgi:hypothetical protein
MPFALYAQDEVVGTEDAAVSQTADLTRGGELYQARGVDAGTIDIDTDCDTLLARNDITIRGTDVPDAPGNAFEDFLGVWNVECGMWNVVRGRRSGECGMWNVECGRGYAGVDEAGALGHTA